MSFLYYKLLTLKSRILELAVSSTFTEITRRDIASLSVLIPPQNEQAAIVNVLSDMDAEIEALECQRNKMKQIKQGMMQQLLTGRG